MGKLIVLDGLDSKKEYLLRSRNILGRNHECSFILKDKGISGTHCKIDKINARDYMISDLQSSNGTYINNRKICGDFSKIPESFSS